MATRSGAEGVIPALGRLARRGATRAKHRLIPVLGGRTRTRVIVVLACVLALSSADTATVGASATELLPALHITNTDLGLLVSVTAIVGAVFSLPFGVLADRVRRTRLLGASVVLWAFAMIWSAAASSFGNLLLSRLALGGVTAVAGPTIASLVGDWFPGDERGQIYSYILTGELLGAGVGFAFTGDLAAISWRLAFVVLALPAFLIAWAVFKLPEPLRGGRGALAPDPGTKPWEAMQRAAAAQREAERQAHPADQADGAPGQPALAGGASAHTGDADSHLTDAQRLARDHGIRPDPVLVARANPNMGFLSAARFVMSVKTNVVLIIAGACGYYFLSGVQTFGMEFVHHQYNVSTFFASVLLLMVGGGAVIGVLVAGPLGDSLLRKGRLAGRVNVAAIAATVTVVLMVPALLTHSALTALPYVVLAAVGLGAQNPPIDAARLDIMPSWLWGRAEGIRTFVRTGAQALAPLLFGAVSDYVFGGGRNGLQWTFVVMLFPLALSAYYLFQAARRYPRDVATAAAAPPPRPQPTGHRRVAGTRMAYTPAADVPRHARQPAPQPAPSHNMPTAWRSPRHPGAGTDPEQRWIGGFGPRRHPPR